MRRKHSKILELPAPEKSAVDALLAANKTYDQIAAEMQRRGLDISKSSVGRYAKDIAEAARELTVVTEQLRPILEKIADNPNLELGSVAAQMGLMQIIKAMKNNPDFVSEKGNDKLLQAAAQLSRSQVAQEKLRLQYKEKLEKASKEMEKVIRKEGLSEDTIAKIRGIYGLD